MPTRHESTNSPYLDGPTSRHPVAAWFLLIALVLSGNEVLHADDWPGFLGPTRDAVSAETGLRLDRLQEGLPIVWQREVGEGYANVTVADGRALVFDRVNNRARLTAVDAHTGTERWQKAYGTTYEDMYGYSGGPRAVPIVDGDFVYTFGVEGRLRAHDVADGAVRFDIDTTTRYGVQKNFFGAGSAPIIEGDLLIVAVGGSPEDSPGIQTGNARANGTAIVAFDKRTGEERYRLGDELASYASPIVADIGGRRLGLHFARGGLLGFDVRAGKQVFHFPWRATLLESVNAATPVVIGDQVFITEVYGPGSALLDLSKDKRGAGGQPSVVWQGDRRDPILPSHWATPIHRDGTLYGSTGRGAGDAELRAVDFASGAVRWKTKAPGRSSLIWVDDHLVVLGEYGEVWLVAATPDAFKKVADLTPKNDAGKPLLRHPAWNAPVLADGLLYLRGKDRVVVLELISQPTMSTAPGH